MGQRKLEEQIIQLLKKNKKPQMVLVLLAVAAVLCILLIPGVWDKMLEIVGPGVYTEDSYVQGADDGFHADDASTDHFDAQGTEGGVSWDHTDTEGSQGSQSRDDAAQENAVQEIAAVSQLKFRNSKLLNDHYVKHGMEMGFETAQEYETAAAAVVANPEALHKTEAEDGDDVYYVESTNEFVIVSKDGYIRTYFHPSAGLDYYNRQ